jgi:hypothetical protein
MHKKSVTRHYPGLVQPNPKYYRQSISVLYVHVYNKQVLGAWFVGDYFLLRDFGPYGKIFVNVSL